MNVRVGGLDMIGWILAGAAILAGIGALVWRPLRRRIHANELTRARSLFHTQREHLEAKFFMLAAASGKPRGLGWSNIDFENDVTYARQRDSGELSSLVGVTISFEAIEGGGMEHVEAVSNLRAATAIFVFRQGKWATDGRTLFNLNPIEAVEFYHDNLELVGHESR